MADPRDYSEVLSRLDTIAAILQLAFKEKIDEARNAILADAVCAAILERTAAGWIEAGALKIQVIADTKQSERTVSRRLATLMSSHAIEQQGPANRPLYRSTGLL